MFVILDGDAGPPWVWNGQRVAPHVHVAHRMWRVGSCRCLGAANSCMRPCLVGRLATKSARQRSWWRKACIEAGRAASIDHAIAVFHVVGFARGATFCTSHSRWTAAAARRGGGRKVELERGGDARHLSQVFAAAGYERFRRGGFSIGRGFINDLPDLPLARTVFVQ